MASYPKLYTLGHRAIRDIFLDDVEVEEKVDGSQFSFGVEAGQIWCASKRVRIYPDSVPALFSGAVDTVGRLHAAGLLKEGYAYRGEAIQSPKHNTICYERIPQGHIALFDIMVGPENLHAP